MNLAIDPRLIARLSTEFTSLSEHLNVLGRDLETLHDQFVADHPQSVVPVPPVPAPPVTGAAVFGAAQPVPPGATAAVNPVPASASSTDVTPAHTGPAAPGWAQSPVGGVGAPSIPQPGMPGGQQVRPPETTGGQHIPGAPAGAGAGRSVFDPAAPGVGPAVASAGPGPQSAPGPGAQPGPGAGIAGPQPGPGVGMGWGQPGVGMPGGQVRWEQGRYQPMPSLPRQQQWRPVPARTPWWQREGVISRVLAVAGVAVTLIGVVMLLVLAAQAGFFGPVPRVVAGAVFSAALVGAGLRVHGKAGGQVGAVALAATGIAGGYLDVVAVSGFYHWLPAVAGYVVALGIAAGGVWLAVRWGSQTLAVLVVAGAAVLAPALSTDIALIGFLIVLQIAALPVHLVRDWPVLHVVRTLPAVLATFAVAALTTVGRQFDSSGDGPWVRVLLAAIVIAAVGLVGALLATRRRSGDVTASLTFAAATLPLLVAPGMFDRRGAVVVAGSFAAVLLAVAAVALIPKLAERVRIPGHLTVVSAVAGAFALLEACLGVTRVQTLPIALLLVALGFLAVGGQLRSRLAAVIGVAYGGLGMLVYLVRVHPTVLAEQSEAEARLGISTALGAVAVLAAVAVGLWCARRLGMMAREHDATTLAVAGGIAALYAVTALSVSLGVATGSKDGFLAGHGIATVVWMVAATAGMLYGLRNLARTPQRAKAALGVGLPLTAAALAKLFLFDLATLDGLVRAGAFLVVGVLLLLVGTRYARAFAEAADRGAPTT